MPEDPNRQAANDVATSYLQRGDATGWFDALYRQAAGRTTAIPWANLRPNARLAAWAKPTTSGKCALVVGCGLGDDAELLSSLGFSVTAFDIAPEAIRWARQRFPQSKIDYQVADAINPPAEWHHRFDLVVEIYTLQALPEPLRAKLFPSIAGTVAPAGQLFVYARARNESDPVGEGPPWRLTKPEILQFEKHGLVSQSFDDLLDDETPPVRRFQAVFGRNPLARQVHRIGSRISNSDLFESGINRRS
jgi:SAM-dependent methyltransferase